MRCRPAALSDLRVKLGSTFPLFSPRKGWASWNGKSCLAAKCAQSLVSYLFLQGQKDSVYFSPLFPSYLFDRSLNGPWVFLFPPFLGAGRMQKKNHLHECGEAVWAVLSPPFPPPSHSSPNHQKKKPPPGTTTRRRSRH